ncbi:MAG: hypothetical protein ABSD32_24470, partial [Mycobacterium sp.]
MATNRWHPMATARKHRCDTSLERHAGIPQSRRNIMGKIALEEHMVLDREDHLDRWRTLVPMIP